MSHASWSAHPMSNPADEPSAGAAPDPELAARVEQLYLSHSALVRSVCRSLLRDPVEADDGVQQTFLSAQRALANGSKPRDAAAWLATIARNESLARVRTRMREPLPVEVEQHGAAPDAHTAAVRRHEAVELRNALAELPQQQREAILLRELRGLSYQEVASSLSVTTSAVESLLFRARRRLQTRLQEALASLSPAPWVQPLREFVTRVLGGGLAGPAAAKLAAVGVGTAVVTGGAVVGPTVLGLGHAPAPVVRSAPPPQHRIAEAAPPEAHVMVWTRPAVHPARVVVAVTKPRHEDRSQLSDGARSETADRSSGTNERERSTGDAGGTTAGAWSSTSGSSRETSDDRTTTQAASGSTQSPTTSTTGDGAPDSSSGTATTVSATRDD
jgi:RNA polymerase sigma factor (sigma-70 family)